MEPYMRGVLWNPESLYSSSIQCINWTDMFFTEGLLLLEAVVSEFGSKVGVF